MKRKHPSRQNPPAQRPTEASPTPAERPRWLVPGVAIAVAIVAVVAIRAWLPIDPRQQFEQALAAYPADLAEAETRLRSAIESSDEPPAEAFP